MVSLLLMLSLLGTLLLPGFAAAESQPDFRGLNDPALLPFIENTLYAQLVGTLNSEDYFVENVSAVYISQEYLDELAYNSQANVFFGFTLAELEAQFQGEKYIFTLGDDGKTAVEPWTDYVDPYEQVIGNVAVGTGVILVCVTVSAVTGGAPACSMIFAVAAKTGALGSAAYPPALSQAFNRAIWMQRCRRRWLRAAGASSGEPSQARFPEAPEKPLR